MFKGCWFSIVGITICCTFGGFHLLLWSQKHNQDQQQMDAKLRLLHHSARGAQKGAGRWRGNFLAIFVSLGIFGSIWLFWHLNEDIMRRREEMLANMCDERARMLQDQFNVSMNHVQALALLVSTFHHSKHPSAIDQVIFTTSDLSFVFLRHN